MTQILWFSFPIQLAVVEEMVPMTTVIVLPSEIEKMETGR